MEGRVLLRGRERNGVNECMTDASLTLGGLDRERERDVHLFFFTLPLFRLIAPHHYPHHHHHHNYFPLSFFFELCHQSPCPTPLCDTHHANQIVTWHYGSLYLGCTVCCKWPAFSDTHTKKQRSLAQHVNVPFIYLFYLHFMSVVSTHRCVWDPALCNLEACKLLKSTKGKEIARGLKLQK